MSNLKPEHIKYFADGEIEIKKFWKRLNIQPSFTNKNILDFGCGHGAFCIEIAKYSPNKIIGIDLENELLKFANENLKKNFKQFNNIIEFRNVNILDKEFDQKFDIILSKDTFEHTLNLHEVLNKFYEILMPGGTVYLGFGPLYNFFNGDHGRTGLFFPWLHTLLPENWIVSFYNMKNNIKINNINDLGLNKYSLKEYKDFFKNSKFDITYFQTNLSDHPLSKIFNLFKDIPILDEYFTNNIYCILKKNT